MEAESSEESPERLALSSESFSSGIGVPAGKLIGSKKS